MKQRFLFIMVIFLLLNSCVEEFELDEDMYKPVLIVNSHFSDNNQMKIFVFKAKNIFEIRNSEIHKLNYGLKDSSFIPLITDSQIADAQVKIIDLETHEEETLTLLDSFYYKTQNIYPQINKNYRIEVSTEGFEPVWAETKIQESGIIESINYLGYAFADEFNNERYLLQVNVKDVENVGNFYEMIVYSKYYEENYYIYSDSGLEYSYVYATFISDNNIDPVLQEAINWRGRSYIFSDQQFANSNHSFNVFTHKISVIDPVTLESIVVEPDNYLVELRTVSEDYYNYQKQYRKHISNSDYINGFQLETGFSNQYAPISLYSNIQNGYGIFSGYSFVRDSIINILD